AACTAPRQCGVHCVPTPGPPATAQPTTFTIQVQDSAGATAQQDFSLTITPPRPLVITSANPCCPAGAVGTAYHVNFFADGGVPPDTWSIIAGQIPPGLSLAPSAPAGLSGTPATAGTFTFTVAVTHTARTHITHPHPTPHT